MQGWEKATQQVSSGEGFGGFYIFQKCSTFSSTLEATPSIKGKCLEVTL